jgi:hypothetical protein
MPVLSDAATVPHRPQISKYALLLCCSCLFATLFGAVAIAISFRMVLQENAGSPAYWSGVVMLLVFWLLSLINMYRIAIRQVLGGSPKPGGGLCQTGQAFAPVVAIRQNAGQRARVRAGR